MDLEEMEFFAVGFGCFGCLLWAIDFGSALWFCASLAKGWRRSEILSGFAGEGASGAVASLAKPASPSFNVIMMGENFRQIFVLCGI